MKRLLLTTLALLCLAAFANAQNYKFSVIYSFPNTGSGPSRVSNNLILDGAGNLYGVSAQGGKYQQGTVFEVTQTGKLTVLYSFKGSPDGAGPLSSLFRDAAGNLYGTTFAGGITSQCANGDTGCGAVYKLTPTGKETVLYAFSGSSDGALPTMSVAVDNAGNVYGTTLNDAEAGGDAGNGLVYKISSNGTFTALHTFCLVDPSCSDGQYPTSGPVLDRQGNVYGVTAGGGQFNGGTFYKVTPAGDESVIFDFANEYESQTSGNLSRDAKGSFYGVTATGTLNTVDGGKIFKVTANGAENVPYAFCVLPGCPAGDEPEAPLQIDSSGNIFGVVTYGGKNGSGGVFKITPNGNETLIYNFPAGFSSYGVVMDTSGNLFGVSINGGKFNAGEVYKLSPQ
jgi:uncharacterized repeat protein (TIGR03803 family)